MAISPIDLQTLFSQVDKVGKQESAQRQGTAIQQAIQQAQSQQQTDDRIRSVNEAQDSGEGAEGIKDRNGGRRQDREGEKKAGEEEEEQAPEQEKVIHDLDLGRNIDISM
jgi:type II secretory pathway pseudopilin PulG